MYPVLEIAGVAFTAFLSTNIDNILLLAALLGAAGQRHVPVLLGYLAAIAVIIILGLAIARLADAVPDALLGYIGMVPLSMGLYRFWGALKVRPVEDQPPASATLGTLGVGALMLSNGTDTLGVLLALFAETMEPLTYVIACTVIITGVLCFSVARWLAANTWFRSRLAVAERWLLPALLIAVGLYILWDSNTDTLL